MDTIDILLIGVIIVAIILIVGHLFANHDDKKRKRASELIDLSAGGNDEFAQGAINEINGINPENRTAEDNYRAGTLLEFNVLNGETENAPRNVLTTIIDAYVDTVDRAAEIAHRRRVMVQHAIENGRDPGEIVNGGNGNENGNPTNIIMLDHIEEFNEINNNDMMGGLFDVLYAHIADAAPVIREDDRETRRLAAAAAAETRAEAIIGYMDATATHTSDAQNVHDGHVNEDLRRTLISIETSLKRDTTLTHTIQCMRDFAASSDYGDDYDDIDARIELINKSLNIISEDNYIGTLQSSEGHVFKCVWDRAEDVRNVANEHLIKCALADALVDSWENNIAVCINGRCSRMLAALVLLDFDDKNGAVQTKEMIKNESIHDATTIIDESIEEAMNSTDPARKLVGEAYDGGDVEASPAEEAKFVAELKQKISSMMDRNYRDKLSARDFTNIKTDILAGVDI